MKLLYTCFFFLLSFVCLSQPANDNCSGAINLGSLPAPAACPSGVGGNVSIAGTLTGATPGNPYIFQNSCTGSSTTMAGPANDVWYSFTATGYTGIFSLTGTIVNPNIALYSGTCAALGGGIGGCAVGTGAGAVTLTVTQMVIGQTYLIQVTSNSSAAGGNFTLTAHNNIGCAECMNSASLTVSPLPVNGAYSPGTTVHFCFHVDNYAEIVTNWLHGVQLSFGPGWNAGSLVATPAVAISCGTWNYYPGGTVSSFTGVTWPAGYYFDRSCAPVGGGTASDGNPGNNYGDHNTANAGGDENVWAIPGGVWNFCFTIQTAAVCSPGSDLSVTVNTSGDGESGNWSSLGCVSDLATVFHAVGACCAPTMTFTPTLCAGSSNGTATATPVGVQNPYTYSWSPGGQTTQTAIGLAAGTYTVYLTDKNNCQITNTVTITSPTALSATSTHTNDVCHGGTTATATATPANGTGAYTYSWDSTPAQTTAIATALPAGTFICTVTDHNGCTTTTTVIITEPAALTATNSQVNVLCHGASTGTATALPVGGTGVYTYSWNTGPSQTTATATALPAGVYICTITDHNGCTTTTTVTITEPAALTATNSQVNVLCHGASTGTATALPVGGTGVYTYSWNTGPAQTTATATALPAGTFICTITDHNGCTTTTSVTITQPAILSATNSQVNILCHGASTGTATALPVGGTGAYTYSWNTGPAQTTATATGLPIGTYICTITDNNGCTTTTTVTLTQPALLSATNSQVNILCHGGSTGTATALPVGGTGVYTYSWNTGPAQTTPTATALPAGTYICAITDHNGCTTTTTVTLTEPTVLSATNSQVNILCHGGSTGTATALPVGGTGVYTYSWNTGPAQTTATATGLPIGTYMCTVTDHNGCTTTTTVTLTQPALLTATNSQTNILCSGGATGTASVVASGGNGAYTYSWAPAGSIGGGQGTANATGLVAGSYICTITDNNGCSITSGVTITQPTAIVIGITSSNASCGLPTGTATITSTTGGTGAYTYSWTPAGSIGGGQGTVNATSLAAATYTMTITDNNGCTQTATVAVSNSGGPTAVISASTNILCNGGATGSATVLASGGSGAYTYSWNSAPVQTTATATGLIAGSYNVAVTDNVGCTTNTSVTLTQPAALTATNTQVNVLCNGASTGSATVFPVGGTGVYTYSWTPAGSIGGGQGSFTATGLAANTYTCAITDHNGCLFNSLVTITQPALLTETSVQTNVSCKGGTNGTATVTPNGGTGAYTYSWTPNGSIGGGQGTTAATGLIAGTYTCTLTDNNGCITSTTLTITEPALLSASNTVVNIVCHGGAPGSATVTALGGTINYTYSWSSAPVQATPTATGLPAGTYTCAVTDANGCTTTTVATIAEPAVLSATTTQINENCNGGISGSATVLATGGTTLYTYSWTPTGGTAPTSAASPAGTYTCTTTDAHGCTTSNVVTITEPAAITATNTQTNILCHGASTGSATVSASGGTGALTFSWSPSGGSGPTASGLTATAYTCAINDANGCNTAVSVTITEPPALVATPSNTPSSCGAANGSASVVATGGNGPYTYSWNTTPVEPIATVPGLLAGNYTCLVQDANGCSVTVSTTILNQGGPVATLGLIKNVTCFGACNGSIAINTTGGTGTLTYSWSPLGGAGTTATALCPNTYTCTVTDVNGCSSAVSAPISQPPILAVTIPASTNVRCNGASNGAAVASATGGSGALTYSWSPSGGATSAALNLTAGLYTVHVTDANGCTQQDTITISQPPLLTISVAGVATKCFGSCDGVLICIPAGGVSPYSYSWNTGCSTPSCNNICTGTYTVVANDANGCAVTGITTVAQPTPLVINMFSVPSHCLHPDGTDSSVVTGGSPGGAGYTYSWTPGIGSGGPVYHNLIPGMYVLMVHDGNGCQAKDSLAVGNTPGVLANIVSTKNTSCFNGTNGWAIAGGTGGTTPYTYSWAAPAVTSADTAINIGAGTYYVVVTDGRGCTSKDSATIFQPTAVVANPMAALTLCIGQCVPLSAAGTGGTPGYTFTWTMGGAPAVSPACPIVTTTYTVIATDINGCISAPAPLIITVRPPLQVVALGDSAVCPGGNVQLNALASGGDGNYSYSWSTALGLNNSGISNPIASPVATTIYTVVIKDGCGTPQAVATDTVKIYPTPNLVFVANDTSGCVQLTVTFTAISNPACANAFWNFGDGTTGSGCNTVTHSYTQPGIYTVIENVTDIHGCPNSLTRPSYIDAWPTPEAAFSLGPQPATIVLSEISFVDHSSGAVSWSWNFGDFANATSTLQNPKYTYPDTGCFTSMLIINNSFGCKDTAYGPLCIHPDFSFYAPNAFTPNGDGKNDFWRPSGLGIDPTTYHMMMFDRWGNLMWETRVWDEGWDGKANNGDLIAQIDTYVWKCSLQDFLGNKHAFTGVCNLIK
jgi:gliding motility-associated-like protein